MHHYPLKEREALPEKIELDELDLRIIRELSEKARDSFREIAKRLGISTSSLINRVRRLEKEGAILGYTATLDFAKLGYEFIAFIEVTIKKGALLDLEEKLSNMRGVVSVYDVTGASDSIIFVRTKSRSELSRLVKNILALPEVERTNTRLVLNVVKADNRRIPGK